MQISNDSVKIYRTTGGNYKRKTTYKRFQFMVSEFQVLLTTIHRSSKRRYNGNFDLHLLPLSKTWKFSKSGNDNYSISGFTAILKRSPNKVMMNTFLPTGLLTVTSFVGFLIPVDIVPGRTALLVTIFLMLVNIRGTEQRLGPQVR